MACWKNQPNLYQYSGFIDIPEGNHRVRICKVAVERFSKGRKCYEITLEVSGYHGKLWHHIWYDPDRLEECWEKFYPFFYSFEIEDYDLSHYKKWVGASGAVSVRYDYQDYGWEAKYIRCLYGGQRDRLPRWMDAPDDAVPDFLKESIF